ncbi:hypothetical protein AGLY_006214 [Aphis glycines]|uniref:Uncharacterized protein n=1 Tax=Aphis glycines TaxID=307491 RepID=A0A6G0TSR3_APHGL|nr:hypothetical protein AGLY_006214 [Aphis glycines]
MSKVIKLQLDFKEKNARLREYGKCSLKPVFEKIDFNFMNCNGLNIRKMDIPTLFNKLHFYHQTKLSNILTGLSKLLLPKKSKCYDTDKILSSVIYKFGNFVINIEGVKSSPRKTVLNFVTHSERSGCIDFTMISNFYEISRKCENLQNKRAYKYSQINILTFLAVYGTYLPTHPLFKIAYRSNYRRALYRHLNACLIRLRFAVAGYSPRFLASFPVVTIIVNDVTEMNELALGEELKKIIKIDLKHPSAKYSKKRIKNSKAQNRGSKKGVESVQISSVTDMGAN